MTQYTVVSADRPEGLATQVNDLLANGWSAQGGVFVATSGEVFMYFQALVR